MIVIESLLWPVVAGLISVKLVLLAAAAVLFVIGVLERSRQPAPVRAKAPARHPRLDVHA